MAQEKYVAYLRVSTQKQGFSGLGLEAQNEIIQNYLHDTVPIAEYVEVESGRKSNRPKLKEALSQCRKEGATLIVAKLDRLARSVSFLSSLLESDVEIVFCDFPQANKMVLHIISAKLNSLQLEPKQAFTQRKRGATNLATRNTYWTSMKKLSGTASGRVKRRLTAIPITRGRLQCSGHSSKKSTPYKKWQTS